MTEPSHRHPAPAKIGLGRSNAVVTIAVLAFLLLIIGAAVRGGLTATGSSARVLSLGIAAVFAVPLVLLLRAMPTFLAPRHVLVDATGLAIQHGSKTVTVAWSDILAVGIGFAVAEPQRLKIPATLDPVDAVKDVLGERLSGAASEALQVSDRRQLALEIVPAGPAVATRYPRLKPYWRSEPAASGLPAQYWRFPLPPVVSIAEEIAAALSRWSPQRWAGWRGRPWREPRR